MFYAALLVLVKSGFIVHTKREIRIYDSNSSITKENEKEKGKFTILKEPEIDKTIHSCVRYGFVKTKYIW